MPQGEGAGRRRAWMAALVVVLLAAIHQVDARTGSAPFQHLYYVPIVIAATELGLYGALAAAVSAVVLYHLANPPLLTFVYRELDVVQIALFIAIGVITTRLADNARRLRRVAETDDLTGLYNLRGFEGRLDAALAAARRAHLPIGMLVLDVDRLKTINDTHGHLAGADAVRTVGHLIGRHLPDGAFACRFGGDEFVVAVPGRSRDAVSKVATAIREGVHGVAPTLAGTAFPARTLSISVGLAAWPDAATIPGSGAAVGEALFRAADEALYTAKMAGRNQIAVASA